MYESVRRLTIYGLIAQIAVEPPYGGVGGADRTIPPTRFLPIVKKMHGTPYIPLRIKLSLSEGCTVALSIILTLFLTWQYVSRFILSSEESHFTSMADVMELNLESSYHEYLTAKVQLRTMSLDARNDLFSLEKKLPNSPTRINLRESLLGNHANKQISISLSTV